MLAQSLDYVGAPDGYSEKELSAALGLWLIGELHHLPKREDFRHTEMLIQIGVSVAEAEFYRGMEEGKKQEVQKLSKRTRVANDQRHAANRERLKDAEKWWLAVANGSMSNAESARQISGKFHVVEPVAKRWIRQFQQRANK
jgi:hypothetical protein